MPTSYLQPRSDARVPGVRGPEDNYVIAGTEISTTVAESLFGTGGCDSFQRHGYHCGVWILADTSHTS